MKGGTAREGTRKEKVRKEMKDRSWADSERKGNEEACSQLRRSSAQRGLVSLSPKAAEVRLASLVSVPGSSAAAMACESLEAIVVGARREVVHGGRRMPSTRKRRTTAACVGIFMVKGILEGTVSPKQEWLQSDLHRQ